VGQGRVAPGPDAHHGPFGKWNSPPAGHAQSHAGNAGCARRHRTGGAEPPSPIRGWTRRPTASRRSPPCGSYARSHPSRAGRHSAGRWSPPACSGRRPGLRRSPWRWWPRSSPCRWGWPGRWCCAARRRPPTTAGRSPRRPDLVQRAGVEQHGAWDNGGTARGFLGSSLRRLHGQPQLQAVRPAVYLFITPLEVNVLNCRFVVPRQARIPW